MKKLLCVRELGGYPDFSPLYRQLGCEIVAAQGMRKAMAALKKHAPELLIAEFNYAPTYGARISTVEALLAAVQTSKTKPRVLLFAEKPHLQHLPLLERQYGVLEALPYPIDQQALSEWIERSVDEQ